MHLPWFRVRTMLVLVAAVGLGIAGGNQIAHLRRCRREYEGEAFLHALRDEASRANSTLTHHEWAAGCCELNRANAELSSERRSGRRLFFLPGPSPEVEL